MHQEARAAAADHASIITNLRAQLYSIQKETARKDAVLGQMTEGVTGLRATCEELRRLCQSQTNDLKLAAEAQGRAERQVREGMQRISDLEKGLSQARESFDVLRSETTARMKTKSAENAILHARCAEFEGHSASLRSEFVQVKALLEPQQQTMESMIHEMDMLVARERNAQRDLSRARAQVHHLEDLIRGLHSRNSLDRW